MDVREKAEAQKLKAGPVKPVASLAWCSHFGVDRQLLVTLQINFPCLTSPSVDGADLGLSEIRMKRFPSGHSAWMGTLIVVLAGCFPERM